MLHHYNTPAHTSLLVREYLSKHETIDLTQQHHSPDLALADFYLIPRLKSTMKRGRCQAIEEIQDNSTQDLPRYPAKRVPGESSI
jgi:hypothetical protein